MSKGLIIGLVIAALVVFWGIGVRNGMATSNQDVSASWAKVESAYQRRADLIPNLVKTVQGVANFEKGTLTDVINARASATQIKLDATDLSPENIQKYPFTANPEKLAIKLPGKVTILLLNPFTVSLKRSLSSLIRFSVPSNCDCNSEKFCVAFNCG